VHPFFLEWRRLPRRGLTEAGSGAKLAGKWQNAGATAPCARQAVERGIRTMIKEGPFFTMDAARTCAQERADRDRKTQYVIVFKASYYVTDDKPQHEGTTPFYQIEGIVEPQG